MYQATTPTLTIVFESTSPDLTTLGDCLVTLKQECLTIDIDNPTVTEHQVSIKLTQEQTQAMKVGTIDVQCNFTAPSGDRTCTKEMRTEVKRNLHNEVIFSGD